MLKERLAHTARPYSSPRELFSAGFDNTINGTPLQDFLVSRAHFTQRGTACLVARIAAPLPPASPPPLTQPAQNIAIFRADGARFTLIECPEAFDALGFSVSKTMPYLSASIGFICRLTSFSVVLHYY